MRRIYHLILYFVRDFRHSPTRPLTILLAGPENRILQLIRHLAWLNRILHEFEQAKPKEKQSVPTKRAKILLKF